MSHYQKQTKNDRKQWENADLQGTKQNIYRSKALMRAILKCNFLLNLGHCVKSYGHLCQVLP